MQGGKCRALQEYHLLPRGSHPPLLLPPSPCPHPASAAADYFNLVLNGVAAFRTDNVLTSDPTTLAAVQTFAGNQSAFFTAFAQVYLKMGAMGATWKSYGATLRSG